MFKTTAVMENTPSLNGLVLCANCTAPMTNTGTHYQCPNATPSSGPNCSTQPVHAQHLLRKVATQLAIRLGTEDNIQRIASNAKGAAAVSFAIQRQRMEEAETAISALNTRRTEALEPVEQGIKTFSDVDEEINEINILNAGLAYESLIARDELDKLEFITQEEGIRDTVMDPETYLAPSNAEEFQEILELVVKEIQVDTKYALVVYNELLAAMDYPKGDSQDLIPLD